MICKSRQFTSEFSTIIKHTPTSSSCAYYFIYVGKTSKWSHLTQVHLFLSRQIMHRETQTLAHNTILCIVINSNLWLLFFSSRFNIYEVLTNTTAKISPMILFCFPCKTCICGTIATTQEQKEEEEEKKICTKNTAKKKVYALTHCVTLHSSLRLVSREIHQNTRNKNTKKICDHISI